MTEHDPANSVFSNDELVDRLQKLPITAKPGDVAPPADQVWARIAARMHPPRNAGDGSWLKSNSPLPNVTNDVAKPRFGRQMPQRRVAGWNIALGVASACVLLVAGMWSRIGTQRSAGTERVYATSIGQRATITLPDGSVVTLAPATRFAIAPTFGRTTRTVTLVGQAYFRVEQSGGVPFVVRTGDMSTHVLGTEFDVQRYAGDASLRVAVIRGKVQSVGSSTRRTPPSVTLTAGMVGTVTDSVAAVTSGADASHYGAWTEGHLDFKQTPVTSVLATVERWYGVRFQVADSSLLAGTVTGSLDFQHTSAVLSTLKSLLGVQMTYDRHGDTTVVTLRRSTTTTRAPARHDAPRVLKPHTEAGR